MHFRTLTPVLEDLDAPFAEHTLSIASGSYTQRGNMNPTVAGGGGMLTTLQKTMSDTTWENAASASVKRNGYIPAGNRLLQQVEIDNFYVKYKEEGSEHTDLIRAKEDAAEAEKSLGNVLERAAHACKSVQ